MSVNILETCHELLSKYTHHLFLSTNVRKLWSIILVIEVIFQMAIDLADLPFVINTFRQHLQIFVLLSLFAKCPLWAF